MNLTIKGIEPTLHEQIKQAAVHSGKSLNNLVLYTLEKTFSIQKNSDADFLTRVQNRRKKLSVFLTDESLQKAKEEGRS